MVIKDTGGLYANIIPKTQYTAFFLKKEQVSVFVFFHDFFVSNRLANIITLKYVCSRLLI